MSIDFRIGPARVAPFRTVDRVAPAGISVPRPFDIRHSWRQLAGRSTGGGYALTDFDAMDWTYAIGVTGLYQKLISCYVPTAPWVWVQMHSPYSDTEAWFEAVMLEPKVARGAGNTVNNIVVSFIQVTPYV
jgi:hypothetical protein